MTVLSTRKGLKTGSPAALQPSVVTFESLGLKSRYITALPPRITHPTPIQALSIPSILTSCTPVKDDATSLPHRHNITISRDVILRAETGSGKTLAMLLPLLQLLDTFVYDAESSRSGMGTQVVYIVPTRELAVQTGNVLEQILNRLTKPHWIVSTVLTGHDNATRSNRKDDAGSNLMTSSRKAEKARLRRGVCIVIGTPGRLLDHLRLTHTWSNSLKNTCKWIVIDEADRLGDLGFEPLVKEIVHRAFCTGSSPHTDNEQVGRRSGGQALILASATAREDIAVYAGVELRSPVFLNPSNNALQVKNNSNSSNTLTTPTHGSRTKHYFVCLPTRQRLDALINLISREMDNGGKVIVFTSCCDAVDYFYAIFSLKDSPVRNKLVGSDKKNKNKDIQVHRLHGKMPQGERLAVLNTFSREQCGEGKAGLLILFSTDVAARGVDFPSVTCTIQYDAPLDPNDYVHRAGRSGRRVEEREGKNYLVLMPSEKGLVERLERGSGLEIRKKRILDREDKETDVEPVEEGVTPSNSMGWQKSFEAWTLDTRNTITLAHKPPHTANATSYTPDKRSHSEEKICIHDLALKAFTGTLRAYATHKSDMRDILHPKNLHLGHLAGCFGLAKAPTLLLNSSNNSKKKSDQRIIGKKRMSERDRVDARRAKLVAAKRKQVDGERTNNLAFVKKQKVRKDRVSPKTNVGRSRSVSEFGAGDY